MAVAAAAMAALTACGGSGSGPADAGRTLPPISSSASSSATSAPSDPTHLTKRQELAAAEATVRRYFKVVNDLTRNMDAHALAALLTPGCKCREQVRSAKYYQRSGGRYIQRGKIHSIGGSVDSRTSAEVLVKFSATPGGVRMASGRIVNRTPAIHQGTDIFYVIYTGRRWLISGIEVAQ